MSLSSVPSRKCAKCSKDESTANLSVCSGCKTTFYCVRHSTFSSGFGTIESLTGLIARPHRVDDSQENGITITCDGDRVGSPFRVVQIPDTHPIYYQSDVCPVSEVVGLPIMIYRHSKEDPLYMERTAAMDNQIATYLMIDVDSGFAPMSWQQAVGTVTVMRQDHRPLTPQAIETMWMYNSHLLDNFGEAEDFNPREDITPADFREFCEDYKEEVNGYGTRSDFMDVQLPF
ncbi:hypothetical protein EW146_g2376 [Bondarzewia mesenterica]|uniref:Uncharacterized protein n=1 Tax=Bondarzewia mesenterica TaxID=1095465 RepID=A0A4S4M0V2_9AGAM|nr:hypothetical protein EW146_g2376 [Bondarzewia mesenterica]